MGDMKEITRIAAATHAKCSRSSPGVCEGISDVTKKPLWKRSKSITPIINTFTTINFISTRGRTGCAAVSLTHSNWDAQYVRIPRSLSRQEKILGPRPAAGATRRRGQGHRQGDLYG